MRDVIISIVNDLNIRENNCPVGARVVVVSYDSGASYLIRWSDYHTKKQLLQLLSQIKYQAPTEAQDIGNAMRFVARNVFKRTYAGANLRRVAVFFSNGEASSKSSIITATMELSALDISPAVFAFNERGFLDEAFGVRTSLGNFISKIAVLAGWQWWRVEGDLWPLESLCSLHSCLVARVHQIQYHIIAINNNSSHICSALAVCQALSLEMYARTHTLSQPSEVNAVLSPF